MASIHKDGGDATWRAAFTCIVGTARVRVKKTTGTADRKLAGRIADFLEDVAAGVLRPEEIHSFIAKISESRAKRAARRGADEALKLVTGRGLGGDSLRTYAEGWLARKVKTCPDSAHPSPAAGRVRPGGDAGGELRRVRGHQAGRP